MYKYYAIVQAKTKKPPQFDLRELLDFSVIVLNAQNHTIIDSYFKTICPRLVDVNCFSTYAVSEHFSTVLEDFEEEFDWLLKSDEVLFITVGNDLLYRHIPTQCAIEEALAHKPVSNIFSPKEWCNLLWVFEKATNMKLTIDSKNHGELELMCQHLDIPRRSISDSDDYCEIVRLILKKLLGKSNIISLSPTCVKDGDKLKMLPLSWTRALSYIR